MRYACLILALALFLPACAFGGDIDDIHQLIEHGRWRAASDRLSEMGDIRSNGSLLFLQGLLERSADRAAHFFETALERGVAVKYQEEIYFRLTQYYLQKNSLSKVSDLTTDYRTRWEKGKYRTEMARMRILAQELTGDRSTAFDLTERYLKSFTKGDGSQWGKVDKARILLGERGDNNGIEQFAELAAGRSDIAVPQALFLLGMYYSERGDIDAAARFYDLLREEYPNAIGLDLLARNLGDHARLSATKRMAESNETQPAAHAGYYSIQVGAFSTERIAKDQVERLRRERLNADIENRQVDGRALWVVYLGRYQDEREAGKVKEKLEKRYGESYEVVPR
jgi:hypothetical protein